jgi:hypothetical protein
MDRPSIVVAVVMRRVRTRNQWVPWQWELAEVLTEAADFGSAPRCLLTTAAEERWLFPNYTVELYQDDGEGYYLNITTDAPSWWVMWRMEEEATVADEPLAVPHTVTLSYHDAGRWLDAQERVEQVSADAATIEWLRAFTDVHYRPEVKERRRPQSFRAAKDRSSRS